MKKIQRINYFAIGIMWFALMTYISRLVGVNADRANHLLQAQDIIRGNVFLKDWNLTGITFFTTDLLYYELGYILSGGLNYRAIYITSGLMLSSVILLSLFAALRNNNNSKITKTSVFMAFMGIPCWQYIINLRIHSGAVCYSILGILIASDLLDDEAEANEKRNIRRFALLFVILMLGCFGDLLTAVEGALPICILCFYNFIKKNDKSKKYVLIIAVTSGAIILSKILEKVYFKIGCANKNSYIEKQLFTDSTAWREKINDLFHCLLVMGDADFGGNKIGDLWNLSLVINASVLFVAFTVSIITIIKVIRGYETDCISTLLCISANLSCMAYIFTGMSESRYLTIVPISAYIILIRNFDALIASVTNKRIMMYVLFIMALISFAGKIHGIRINKQSNLNQQQYELINYLRDNNLTNGYASFWNASIMTVLSSDKVHVRHIRENRGRFEMYNWFCKNDWYNDEANFILILNGLNDDGQSDAFGVSKEKVTAYFGEPAEVHECAGYLVLSYDHDISEQLLKVTDGIQHFEQIANENVVEENDTYILKQGGMVYGPYVRIDEGEFIAQFNGKNLVNAACDIYSESSPKNIEYDIINKDNDRIIVDFKIFDMVNDIEFRTFNDTDKDVRLNEINILRKEK